MNVLKLDKYKYSTRLIHSMNNRKHAFFCIIKQFLIFCVFRQKHPAPHIRYEFVWCRARKLYITSRFTDFAFRNKQLRLETEDG